MIRVRGLTKRYHKKLVVDDLTFDVRPGLVTGFLGPNGAGKSTTMRILLGLDAPTAGEALVGGRRYSTLDQPLRHVGALLETDAFHPGRSARNHLRVAARSNGIPLSRVDEILEAVGLASVANRRVKGFSLGMRQRLGIGAALLGDPPILLFDEPVNGLDVDGVRWVRDLVRGLAAEGRTVLVSSHLLSEMQATADHLVVIGRGQLIADAGTSELIASIGSGGVRVRTEHPHVLMSILQERGATAEEVGGGEMMVTGLSTAEVGQIARESDLVVYELSSIETSLEQAYVQLTTGKVDHIAGGGEEDGSE